MGMKTLALLCIFVVSLSSGCATRRDEFDERSGPGRFVGAWRLVSWTSSVDGQTNYPFGKDANGFLLYTATGQMSVFLSRPNRPSFDRATASAGTAEEKIGAFDSCFAYAGTCQFSQGQVTHRLEHCTFPNWVGTAQVRFVRFEGNWLILETPPLPAGDRQAVSRLVWEKAER